MTAFLPLGVAAGALLLAIGALLYAVMLSGRVRELEQAKPVPSWPDPEPALRALRAEVVQLQRKLQHVEQGANAKLETLSQSTREFEGWLKRQRQAASPPPPRPARDDDSLFELDQKPGLNLERAGPAQLGPDPAWVAGLLSDFNGLAEDQAGALERFMRRYEPQPVITPSDGAGYRLGGDADTALLWAISAEREQYALLPSARAIRNWSTVFASSRSAAQEHYGPAFELRPETPRFAAPQPAYASERGGLLQVEFRGRLEGFLN